MGESFDELTYDEKWNQYADSRAAGITKAKTFKDYSDGLYRPKTTRKKRKVTLDPQTSTIQDAKNWLNEKILKGTNCPVCRQKVKVYKRHVTHKQAAMLVLLYKTFPVGTTLDINRFVQALQPAEFSKFMMAGREWHKLKYWGLLEEVEVTPELKKAYRDLHPGKGRINLHQLTDRGSAFVQGAPIVKFVYVFDDVVRGWDESTTCTLQDALEAKFDFQALMNAAVPSVGQVL